MLTLILVKLSVSFGTFGTFSCCQWPLKVLQQKKEKKKNPTQKHSHEQCLSTKDERIMLERMKQKDTHVLMHGSTLSEYWKNKKIPRGPRIQKALTIDQTSEQFVKQWSEILNKSSLGLMLLIIKQVTQEAQEIQLEIQKQDELIKQKFGDAFIKVEQSVMETTQRYKESVQETKIKNYKRDTEDYRRNEVYIHGKAIVILNKGMTRHTHAGLQPHQQGTTGEEPQEWSQDSALENVSSTYSSRDSSSSSFLTNSNQRKKKDADGVNVQQRQRPRPRTQTTQQIFQKINSPMNRCLFNLRVCLLFPQSP